MAPRGIPYHPDPQLREVPLVPEDLEWADGAGPRRERDPFWHLAARALATARELRAIRARFDHEVRRRVDLHARSTAVAGSVSPKDAVRFLTPDEIEDLFDTYARQRLAALEGQRSAAEQAQSTARTALQHACDTLQQAADAMAGGQDPAQATEMLRQEAARLRAWQAGQA